jgi:hypothetical protein
MSVQNKPVNKSRTISFKISLITKPLKERKKFRAVGQTDDEDKFILFHGFSS